MNDKEIIEHIPQGKENAISRKTLCALTGLCDREVRELISRARRDDAILAREEGGYYRPTHEEREELSRWIKREERRARSIFWSMRGAKLAEKEFERRGHLERVC